MKRVIPAILLSLLFHFLTGYGIIKFPNSKLSSLFGTPTDSIEVDIKNLPLDPIENKIDQRQKVLQAIVPPNMLKHSDDLAKLLSEKRQRVQEEMVAKQTGYTVNRTNQNNSLSANKATLELFKRSVPIELIPRRNKKNQEVGFIPKSSVKQGSVKTQEPNEQIVGRIRLPGLSGLSTFNERIENSKVGEITALNTDTDLFYSFYQRMISQIRFHWERDIESATDQAAAMGLLLPRKDEWPTQTSFELDATGRILDAQVDRISGIKEFDDAAIMAIRAGGPFINPPREMVEPDGRIRMRLTFTVNWIPPRMLSAPSRSDPSDTSVPKF